MLDNRVGTLLRCLASIERGQSSVLVSSLSFGSGARLTVAGVDVELPLWESPSAELVLRALAHAGVQAADPVEDSPDRILDTSEGGHIVWVETLQYLGNFYRTAFLESSPQCRITQVRYGEPFSFVSAVIMNDAEVTFRVPMDDSYEVVPIAFDIAYALKNGLDSLT